MSRARLIVVLTAVAAVVSMGLAGSALASYSVVRDSGWVQFNTAGLPDSDCWMQNQLVQDPLSGYAYGRGRTYCYNNHTSIQVVERLAVFVRRILTEGGGVVVA